MTNNSTDNATRLLEGAYAIRTSDDSIDYYREFADQYDRDYAERIAVRRQERLSNSRHRLWHRAGGRRSSIG